MSIDQKVMRAPDAVCRQEYRTVDGRKHLDAVVWSSKLLGLSVRLPLGLVERPVKTAGSAAEEPQAAEDQGAGQSGDPILADSVSDDAGKTGLAASGDLQQKTDKRRHGRQERKD
jgi:hypothetical protein